jgi:hypothetical protein
MTLARKGKNKRDARCVNVTQDVDYDREVSSTNETFWRSFSNLNYGLNHRTDCRTTSG